MATKEVKITVPTDWSAITLKKYLEFQKDLKVYGDEESGYVATLLHHFCGVGTDILPHLDIDTYAQIKEDLVGFIGNTELPLQRIIKIDGKEYGFEPNLSKISYGAYLDISKYDTLTIDENWSKIMSILYRPVTKKMGALYEIESYKGLLLEEKFTNVTMDIHFGAISFFLSLLMDLPPVIQKSMKEMEQPLNTN
jgi:hypothetical protein